jgi:hypothetical protein
MNVDVALTIHWTSGPAPTPNARAWIILPEKMPYYGTPAFKKLKLDIFILKYYAATTSYREFAITIAHELSHVVLESIQHPLRDEEKAVDLTAMLLGFSYFYRTTAHAAQFVGLQRVGKSHLGYLSERELDAACQILVPPKMRVQHALLEFAKHARALMIVVGVVFAVSAYVAIYEWWTVHEIAVAEQAQLERLLPVRYGSMTLTAVHVWLTSLIREFTVDRRFDFLAAESAIRRDLCASRNNIKKGVSYTYIYRRPSGEQIARFDISSCP